MAVERVVVPGSIRPFLAAGASTLLLGGLGAAAVRASGTAPGAVVALALAAIAAGVLLLDLPRRTEVDATGVVRVCLLRRERIPWDRAVAVERQRRRFAGPGTGGLVLRGRRGRWLITTAAEPPSVHAALAAVVAAHAPSVRMRAEPPRTETDPR